MKSLISGSLILMFSAVVACTSGGSVKTERAAGQGHESGQASANATVGFKSAKVKEVYVHYLHVKDALVRSDQKEARNGALALRSALEKIGNAKGGTIAAKLAGMNTLSDQRAQFDALTAEVEKLIKSDKVTSGKVYKQHCPMANNGKGGYWLASESNIRNPYYGDEMLSCGSVEEEMGPGAVSK
ncbi:DUF3347 domain-containing protein [Arcticibacter sp. MXS-1]|uniref:DUF3347 domain-containing protein n=1 Tax=Arcticibacter sp. MXS-1 TaxID=3341726 RepID=UPI0035A8636A